VAVDIESKRAAGILEARMNVCNHTKQLVLEHDFSQKMITHIEPTVHVLRSWMSDQHILQSRNMHVSTTIGLLRRRSASATLLTPASHVPSAPEQSGHENQTQTEDTQKSEKRDVRDIFSPIRYEAQPFQLGKQDLMMHFADPAAALAKLHEKVMCLFSDFDVTCDGKLGRIELLTGLADYGYLQVEADIVFHIMDQNQDGKITYPHFFRSIWLMSEHVFGMWQLLHEAYGVPINEDGLRRVVNFLVPRVIVLQRKWRQIRATNNLTTAQVVWHSSDSNSEGDVPPAEPGRGALLLKIFENLRGNEEDQKIKNENIMLARLQVINHRAEQAEKKLENARLAANRWKKLTHEHWPDVLKHVKGVLEHKDARAMLRYAHSSQMNIEFTHVTCHGVIYISRARSLSLFSLSLSFFLAVSFAFSLCLSDTHMHTKAMSRRPVNRSDVCAQKDLGVSRVLPLL